MPSFGKVEAGLAVGKMPHEWIQAPFWSRLQTLAAQSARRKLDYLQAKSLSKDGGERGK